LSLDKRTIRERPDCQGVRLLTQRRQTRQLRLHIQELRLRVHSKRAQWHTVARL